MPITGPQMPAAARSPPPTSRGDDKGVRAPVAVDGSCRREPRYGVEVPVRRCAEAVLYEVGSGDVGRVRGTGITAARGQFRHTGSSISSQKSACSEGVIERVFDSDSPESAH